MTLGPDGSPSADNHQVTPKLLRRASFRLERVDPPGSTPTQIETRGTDDDNTLHHPQHRNRRVRDSEVSPTAFHNGRRGRFNAWFFTAFDGYIAHIAQPHKQQAFRDMAPGTVVEIGAGVGANFGYVPAGTRLIAVEPNVAMHDRLLERAAQRSVDIELVADDAHHLPLDDATVDDVVCSLVLCTVADPAAVLTEIRRVLRPGGRFRFVEHVTAPWWSPRRWVQHAVRSPWSWIYEGCDVCRDTAATITDAGFAHVALTSRLRHSFFVPVNTAIHGIATN